MRLLSSSEAITYNYVVWNRPSAFSFSGELFCEEHRGLRWGSKHESSQGKLAQSVRACPCASAMMLAPDGAAAVDEILIAELQRRLRGAGGPKPKDQYVRLALALARDPALVPMRVHWSKY